MKKISDKRKEEEEILKKMFDGTESPSNMTSKVEKKPASSPKTDSSGIRCPKCGYLLENRRGCPRCGYNGYIPMSEEETKKTKLILYPIVLVVAILIYLITKGIIKI